MSSCVSEARTAESGKAGLTMTETHKAPHGATLPDLSNIDLAWLPWREWPALLTRAEAGVVARCCARTIARAQAAGRLGAVRRHPYGPALVRREDLARWLGVAP